MMKIAFRADATIQIGTGHIMRCLTLADALREHGVQTSFICRDLPGFPAKLFKDRGHELHMLPAPLDDKFTPQGGPAHAAWLRVPWEEDAAQTSRVLQRLGKLDWLVIDHYALDCCWEESLRPYTKKIMVIDDLADRNHDCDLLLDQTMAASDNSYVNLVPPACHFLLGPKYALLRPQFFRYRENALERKKRVSKIRNVLIAMGGTDPENITGIVLQGLDLLDDKNINVTVVLGSSAPYLSKVAQQAQNFSFPVRVLSDVKKMAELMAEQDVCVGSGGMTAWERCVLGVPSIVIVFADNQAHVIDTLSAQGAVYFLGKAKEIFPKDIKNALFFLKENPETYRTMVDNCLKVCDGKGTKRVLSSILAMGITLRLAEARDCRQYWAWANDPIVRESSFSSATIPYEDHVKWFHSKLDDPESFLYVADLMDGTPVGQIRFEYSVPQTIISVSVGERFRGFGLGTPLIKKSVVLFREQFSELSKIIAKIRLENDASIAMFQRSGFVNVGIFQRLSGDSFVQMILN